MEHHISYWYLPLCECVCMRGRDKDGNRGSNKSMINNYKADRWNKAPDISILFLLGLISVSANISFTVTLNYLQY